MLNTCSHESWPHACSAAKEEPKSMSMHGELIGACVCSYTGTHGQQVDQPNMWLRCSGGLPLFPLQQLLYAVSVKVRKTKNIINSEAAESPVMVKLSRKYLLITRLRP